MLSYVKISYKTNAANSELKKCIEYIGEIYGNNKKYNTLFKSGKAFLAKKVKGATKTSINYMVYPKKIKNTEYKQWCFKKNAYERAYRYIIYIMLQKCNNIERSLSLLQNLYLNLLSNDYYIPKTLSNILVHEQKDLLLFASDKPQYETYKNEIKKIQKTFEDCDEKIYKSKMEIIWTKNMTC